MITRLVMAGVFTILIVWGATVNAGIKGTISDTVIHATVHALVKENDFTTRVDVITPSGNLYSFHEDVVLASLLRVGHPVTIEFHQEEIEGFRFDSPRLNYKY